MRIKLVSTLILITLLAGFILAAGCSGSSSPAPQTQTHSPPATYRTPAPTPIRTSPPTQAVDIVQVRISYPGRWMGAIVYGGNTRTIDGTGNKVIDLPSDTFMVSVNAQKSDGGGGSILKVEVVKNGKVVASESTNSPYGLAGTSTYL